MKWNIQLNASEEEKVRCAELRDDASLKLIDLSRMICRKKCSDLQNEIKMSCEQVDHIYRTEIDRWAVDEKRRLDLLKEKKVVRIKESRLYRQFC